MKETLYLLAVFTIGFMIGFKHADETYVMRMLDESCTTDSECLELCPPDDKECDGGPQSVQEKA